MCPDTNRISPQPTGSAWNYDGDRWEGISILPDRGRTRLTVASARPACWSWTTTTGVVTSVSGSARWTASARTAGRQVRRAQRLALHGAYIAPSDGSHDYTSETDCGTNPNIAVWSHGGQPGTTWDLYNVKAAESTTTGCDRSAAVSRTVPAWA